MKFPWANVLLLALVTAAFVSGYFGLTAGLSEQSWYLDLHQIGGLAILAILGWKAGNVVWGFRRRLRHRVRGIAARGTSSLLGLLLLVALATGLAWSWAGPYSFLLFSGVSWHIYVAVATVPLLLWHTWRQVKRRPMSYWLERRSFLRLGGLAVVGLLLWRVQESALLAIGLPGKERRFTGSYESDAPPGNGFPVVSWLNDRTPQVNLASWRLSIEGEVERTVELAYADLAPASPDAIGATLDCTGGWYTTQQWRGVPLHEVLQQAGVKSTASSVTITSLTGYYRRFSLKEAEGLLLATHVGDEALSPGHGFPVRLVAPGKRGFEWVKWVSYIHVNDTSKLWQPPLPLQ